MATTELVGIVQKREFNPQQEVSQGKPDPGILLAGAGMSQQVRSGNLEWLPTRLTADH